MSKDCSKLHHHNVPERSLEPLRNRMPVILPKRIGRIGSATKSRPVMSYG